MSNKSLFAYYGLLNGGSGCRTIHSNADIENILRGGYNATSVTIETKEGEIIGQRYKRDGKWCWSYDQDYFGEAA